MTRLSRKAQRKCMENYKKVFDTIDRVLLGTEFANRALYDVFHWPLPGLAGEYLKSQGGYRDIRIMQEPSGRQGSGPVNNLPLDRAHLLPVDDFPTRRSSIYLPRLVLDEYD